MKIEAKDLNPAVAMKLHSIGLKVVARMPQKVVSLAEWKAKKQQFSILKD